MIGALLNAKAVSVQLGVSEPTVYQLAHRGALESVAFSAWEAKPGAKPRKTIRFTEQAVADFIQANTRQAAR